MKVEDYLCRRLLEKECGFSEIYNGVLEVYYQTLDEMYIANKAKMNEILEGATIPIAKDFMQLEKHYISLLQGIVPSNKTVDFNIVSRIFISTRCYIQFYKQKRKGDFRPLGGYGKEAWVILTIDP